MILMSIGRNELETDSVATAVAIAGMNKHR